MPYVSGWLIEGADPGYGNRPGGPVDPGFGVGGGPVDPGWGNRPPVGGTLPEQPPQVWPPINWHNPIAPIIDNTLPVQPGTIWPSPGRPPHIDHTLPGGGGQVDNTLPSQTFWMIAYCPSLGWKYVSVDPSLRPGMPLPPHPEPK
jgi:hypothetical protein